MQCSWLNKHSLSGVSWKMMILEDCARRRRNTHARHYIWHHLKMDQMVSRSHKCTLRLTTVPKNKKIQKNEGPTNYKPKALVKKNHQENPMWTKKTQKNACKRQRIFHRQKYTIEYGKFSITRDLNNPRITQEIQKYLDKTIETRATIKLNEASSKFLLSKQSKVNNLTVTKQFDSPKIHGKAWLVTRNRSATEEARPPLL